MLLQQQQRQRQCQRQQQQPVTLEVLVQTIAQTTPVVGTSTRTQLVAR